MNPPHSSDFNFDQCFSHSFVQYGKYNFIYYFIDIGLYIKVIIFSQSKILGFEDQYSSTIVFLDTIPFFVPHRVREALSDFGFSSSFCAMVYNRKFSVLASNVYLTLTFDLLVNTFCDPTLIEFGVDVTMDLKKLTSFRVIIQINVYGRGYWLQTLY